MMYYDVPPMYEPPAIIQEVRRKKRNRSRSYDNRHNKSSRQRYQVRVPAGVWVAVGVWLMLDDNTRCYVTAQITHDIWECVQ
jgi:hypothetical protein